VMGTDGICKYLPV